MILGQYTTVQAIRNILVEEMSYLMTPERIFIYNQEFKLPPDQNAWIVIKQTGSRVYSNQNLTYLNAQNVFTEEQDLYTQDNITITIMSKNLQALQYKEGIPMALRSVFSQQQQETYTFKVAMVMPIIDLSELEGGSMYYRFDVSVNILAVYQLLKTQQYFNSFETQVLVSDGTVTTTEFNPTVLP